MSPPTPIGIVDYGMGNRRSVQKALEHVGARASISRDRDELGRCHGLVVPGVGAFPRAMQNLDSLSLSKVIREHVERGRPLLGICLGMQLLFDGSEELERTAGLGIMRGEVTSLDTRGLPLPHIGWNEVSFERCSALTAGLPTHGCPFYHVHSLAPRPGEPADVIATTEYGERFATIVGHGSAFGVQFHPEKSSRHGLRMLENFVRLCTQGAAATAQPAAARA